MDEDSIESPDDPETFMRRMDFVSEVTEKKGEEDGYARYGFVMKPNPDRYERVDEDNRSGWLDTMDNVFIPDSTLEEAAEQMDGIPIYFDPPDIEDFEEYAKKRRQFVRDSIRNDDIDYNYDNQSNVVLNDLSDKDNPKFVIMVVDLVGSTDKMIETDVFTYNNSVKIFLNEVRTLVRRHSGYVLKFTGDGLIAYFSEPNLTGKHDNSITCAFRVQQLVEFVLNPVFDEYDHPQFQCRVGMDSGSAEIFSGAQDTEDLLGSVVSIAAKIESIAEPGEVLMGELTERNLHTDWRKRTSEVTDDRDWDYSKGEDVYSVYTLEMD